MILRLVGRASSEGRWWLDLDLRMVDGWIRRLPMPEISAHLESLPLDDGQGKVPEICTLQLKHKSDDTVERAKEWCYRCRCSNPE
jgi:hypothetical protein